MVTHDQEEAQTMADRIFVMKNGHLVESGTQGELLGLEDGVYRRLYELQIETGKDD